MNSATTSNRLHRAFTLIEVLVVVALLSVIILGLVTMFSQTQRAYTLGMTQVDVLEGGRAVTEMITRDASQIFPSHAPRTDGTYSAFNFLSQIHITPPLMQRLELQPPLPPSIGERTNLMQDVFFLTKENQTWTGIGYRVLDSTTGLWPDGMGTLYRYQTNAYFQQDLRQLFSKYAFQYNPLNLPAVHVFVPSTNMTRVLENVVHFKVRAFDANGVWIRGNSNNIVNYWPLDVVPDEPNLTVFYSNAVPASIEFELGILEERTAARARAILNATRRRDFLTNQVGKVHVFRWRVPVRNVDPTAYQ